MAEPTCSWWIFLLPIILIQLVAQIFATKQLIDAKKVRWDNKVIWGVIIWLFQLPGPVIFLLFGKEE